MKSGAFAFCSNLEEIIIPNGTNEINSYAFSYCSKLSTINIPNSVSKIDRWSFIGCSTLETILIPDSVIEIEGNPFCYGCDNLKIINVESENPYYASENGILLNKDKNKIIAFPNGKIEEDYTISNNIKTIGEFGFGGCANLKTISIPNSITDIEEYAFTNCPNLISIEIPNSITEINDHTFEYCSSLKTIIIPDNITIIGAYVFSDCVNLENITIPNSVTQIGNNVFDNCEKLSVIYVEKDSYAEQYAINNNFNYEYISDDIIFKNIKELNINDVTYLVNFDTKNNTVNDIINSEINISKNNYVLKFYKGNNEITGNEKVGTGTIIRVMNEDEIKQEYVALLYGDTTGNGSPSAVDALAVIKNKLGTTSFSNTAYEEAGRVTESARLYKEIPSSVDALAIIKYKLNKGNISQYIEPKISVQKDGQYLVINVKDQSVITLVEYTLSTPNQINSYRINLKNYDVDYYNNIEGLSVKTNSNNEIVEMEYRQLMSDKGKNTINIIATNKNDIKTTYKGTCQNT